MCSNVPPTSQRALLRSSSLDYSSYATPRFNGIQLLSIADRSRRCTNGSASTIIGTSASCHFHLNDSLAWRGADPHASSCTILQQSYPKYSCPYKPLQTPTYPWGIASAPAAATALSGTDKRASVRLATLPHYHSIHSTSLGHACRAFHHRACILNSPSHQLLGHGPRISFRPQMTLWYSNPGLGNWLEDA